MTTDPAPAGTARASASPGSGAAPLLSVRELRVSFGPGRDAVTGLTLDASRGEVVAIVGESGCGKTLSALALTGLLPPGAKASGSARIGGTELIGASERQMRVRVCRGMITSSMKPRCPATKGFANLVRYSSVSSAIRCGLSISLRKIISTAPFGPITAISAVGQAMFTSPRRCFEAMTS